MAVTPAARARFVHVSIDAKADRVYASAADPGAMPRWAPNFARSVRRCGHSWTVEMDEESADLRFAAPNAFGVLDHWVRLPSGETFYNPMRVVADGAGSVIAFTLFRQPDWSDERLEHDAALVRADLERLKQLIETEAGGLSPSPADHNPEAVPMSPLRWSNGGD